MYRIEVGHSSIVTKLHESQHETEVVLVVCASQM